MSAPVSAFGRITPRHVFLAVVFLAGLLVLGLAFGQYRDSAAPPPVPETTAQPEQAEPLLEEMAALFAEPVPDPQRFAVIAERNLFSPERTPWAPPPPAPPLADTLAAALQPQPPAPPAGPRDIRLYGTQISAKSRLALLYFGAMPSSNKHRLAREGERIEEGGQTYLLVRIDPETVTLRTELDQEFAVGLYDHQRHATPGKTPADRQPVIHLGGTQRPADTAAAAQANATRPGQDGESTNATQARPFPLLQPNEEMERLVEEGRMRRIETPFGTIYRPLE